MIRSLIAAIVIGLTAGSATSQQTPMVTSQAIGNASPVEPVFPDKPEAMRLIALKETAAQQAEASHSSDQARLKIYRELGALYESVAMYKKSENAVQRAIALLRKGPQDQLADEVAFLAVVHFGMGQAHEAEKEQLEALRIRESIGDPIGAALAQSDLAAIYVRQHHFKKAVEFAQKSMDVIGDNAAVSAADRVSVRETLATALCEVNECARGIPLLKDAVELAGKTFGPDSGLAGLGLYLLGTAYWHIGDIADAADCMQRGTAEMKVHLGWGHPSYVGAMTHYVAFLRQRGQLEAAAVAESEIVRLNSVVDVNTFTSRH